jgi:hypothetical protein
MSSKQNTMDNVTLGKVLDLEVYSISVATFTLHLAQG